jgi:hypothetical protein
VNNTKSSLSSTPFPFRQCELFTGFMKKNWRGEQVCFVETVKKPSPRRPRMTDHRKKEPPDRAARNDERMPGIKRYDAAFAGAAFLVFDASFFRLR